MTDSKAWLAQRTRRGEDLYERYGKALEKHHTSQYVAIEAEGQTIVGASAAEVLHQAVPTFGSGNFALKRVGHRTFGKWLTASR